MPLTDYEVRRQKPREKPYKLADGAGLHLLVTTAGGRLWRLKYRFGGKEKLLALGAYPDVSLREARDARDEARAVLRSGRDPAAVRKAAKLTAQLSTEQSFGAIAGEWHAKQRPTWTERHAADVLQSFEASVFPALGSLHINEITPPLVLAVLRAIEARPAVETAHRVRQRMSAVFVYAIASGVGQTDPAAIVKGALSPIVRGKQPAIIELDALRAMLRRAEAEPAHPATKGALRLLALTAVRPGELRGARWDELDGLDGTEPVWRIPAERMKMKAEHVVPLVAQAVELLEAMRPFTGRMPLIFPNSRHAHRPMTENAIGYLLNRCGYHHQHVPHGFRAAFSSVMNERHPGEHDAIEAALAHAVPGTRGAYMRAPFLARRRELLAEWAALLLDGAMSVEEMLMGPRKSGSFANVASTAR